MGVSKAENNAFNFQSLKHFNMRTSDDLKKNCPWIYNDKNESVVYDCDQDNRPSYRHINGSCNFLAGSTNYDRHQVQLFWNFDLFHTMNTKIISLTRKCLLRGHCLAPPGRRKRITLYSDLELFLWYNSEVWRNYGITKTRKHGWNFGHRWLRK